MPGQRILAGAVRLARPLVESMDLLRGQAGFGGSILLEARLRTGVVGRSARIFRELEFARRGGIRYCFGERGAI